MGKIINKMKSFAIAALIGVISAVKLNSCIESGMGGWGLTCVPPNNQLFATGANGDEDLGEDIIMKGKPFHYNQKLAQEAPEEGSEAEEKAEAKEEDKMKEAEEKANKAKVKNIAPAEKVSVLETAIAKEHTTFYDKKMPKNGDFVQLGDGVPGYEDVSPESEKVSVLDLG